jgi:hypothetical protein
MARVGRRFAGVVFIVGLVAFMMGGGLITVSATPPSGTVHKVTICHRTDADSNPYVVETVDIASAGEAMDAKGHASHTGPVWQAGDQAAHIKWGDIIPPYTYFGFSFPGLNWTAQGMAIYNNGCKPLPLTSPSPSAPPSQSPSPSASPSESPEESPTPSESPEESPTPSESPEESPTPSASPTATPAETPTATPSSTPTASGAPPGTPSPSPTPSGTPPGSPSATPTPSGAGSAPTPPGGGAGGTSLAVTGANSTGADVGAVLTLIGLTLMVVGAVAYRRRES